MSKILLLEDDDSLIDALEYSLQKNDFTLDTARTVAEALAMARENPYDLLLLDVALPDGTGFEVCSHMRNEGNQVPIIFLTAADEEVNVIRGLDSGGDDYITKPFKIGELCSRIRALLRRAGMGRTVDSASIRQGMLEVDLVGSRILKNGVPLQLTSVEYRLLCLLIRNTGQTLTRSRILDELWDGSGNFVDDNTLSVYIRRLREKVEEDPSHPRYLLTDRGLGYRWTEVER